jgi:hypothetical protein
MSKVEPLEILLLVLLGGFAALFLILTWDYNPTAALFPRWVAIASVLFLGWSIANRLLGRGRPAPRQEDSDEEFVQPAADAMPWPAVLSLQGLYIAGIYFFGFTQATLLYLFAAPIHMRYRKWGIIAAQAVLLTIIIAGSFIWFFHIRLPRGIVWEWW